MSKTLTETAEVVSDTCSLAQTVSDQEIPEHMLEIDIRVDMRPRKRYSLSAEVVTRKKAEHPLAHPEWIDS